MELAATPVLLGRVDGRVRRVVDAEEQDIAAQLRQPGDRSELVVEALRRDDVVRVSPTATRSTAGGAADRSWRGPELLGDHSEPATHRTTR